MSAIGHIRSPPCPNRHHRRSGEPTAPPIRPAGPTRRQPTSSCCNLASALPQVKPCANRVVTTRRQPVVTTREMPQRTRAYTGLAQVTAPSDELTTRQSRRPCNAICPARSKRAMSAEAPVGAPRTMGKWLNPMGRFATAKRHRRQAACRGGKWKTSAQNGSGVPGPL